MNSFISACKGILFFVAITFSAPVSAQVVVDLVLLTAPEENGNKTVSYEELTKLDPATLLDVVWSDQVITKMTAAELLAWFAAQ